MKINMSLSLFRMIIYYSLTFFRLFIRLQKIVTLKSNALNMLQCFILRIANNSCKFKYVQKIVNIPTIDKKTKPKKQSLIPHLVKEQRKKIMIRNFCCRSYSLEHSSILFTFSLLLYSCVKDKPNIQSPSNVNISASHKVYITNEGNFMYNNASVTFYDPITRQVIQDIFKSQNPTHTLGDVCQSISKIGNEYYLVVNNSSKIVIVNADDLKYKYTIMGFISPRYILPVSYSKAYVSDLYANKIAIVNLPTKTITSYVPCNGWTEKMIQYYGKVFVSNLYKNYVYVIDAIQDIITDSIYVGKYLSGLVLDKNDNLWILSSGDASIAQNPQLLQVNPVNHQVLKTFTFSSTASPHHLIIDSKRENLFFIDNHIYKMNINDTQLPGSPFITSVNNNFYSMEWSGFDDNLYVSDAMDYIQNSTIYRYNSSGQLIHSFKAGINASGFWME